jgi:hypothetical protein
MAGQAWCTLCTPPAQRPLPLSSEPATTAAAALLCRFHCLACSIICRAKGAASGCGESAAGKSDPGHKTAQMLIRGATNQQRPAQHAQTPAPSHHADRGRGLGGGHAVPHGFPDGWHHQGHCQAHAADDAAPHDDWLGTVGHEHRKAGVSATRLRTTGPRTAASEAAVLPLHRSHTLNILYMQCSSSIHLLMHQGAQPAHGVAVVSPSGGWRRAGPGGAGAGAATTCRCCLLPASLVLLLSLQHRHLLVRERPAGAANRQG